VSAGANFFVDAADVETPEPGTVFGAASALLLLAGYGLRRR
jgi:MYXO-CTERM domain-containing protein